MNKKYLILILFLSISFHINAQDIIITTVVDGTVASDACLGGSGSDPRFVELYISGTVDFNNYDLDVSTNGGSWVSKDISALGTITNQYVYLVQNTDTAAFNAAFPGKTNIAISLGTINGNDAIRVEDPSANVLDIFGDPSEITSSSTFTGWNYQDSYVKRKNGKLPNRGVFIESDFSYPGANALDGATCTTLVSMVNTESFLVWQGDDATNPNDWNTAENWSTGAIPISTDDVSIFKGSLNYPTINSPLTINSVSINSGTSLIANATVTGNVTYARNLPTTNWYLVSMPLSGETYDDLIANHAFATGSGSNIGIGTFTNLTGSAWNYATGASAGALPNQGYAVKLAAAGNLSISGTINSSTINNSITLGTRNNFNLIGNPFTAYVNSATFAAANTALLTEETLWLWNGTQYVTYNAMTPIEIAPVQGFFVEAASAGNVTFSTANQSHQGIDTFMKLSPTASLELSVESGKNNTSTKLFYIDGKTTGFDNGYDSKMFGGVDYDFKVFTELVTDNKGKKLAIQTLPKNLEAIVVPIGLIAEAGKEISFSANATNLPVNINIYLENRDNNTFTNLSEGKHTVTLKTNSNGSGQYFIHTSAKNLTDEEITESFNKVKIYKSSTNKITVTGLQDNSTLTIYSVIGKEVFKRELNAIATQNITLPKIPNGIYIVKLSSKLGKTTKKLLF